MASLPGAMGLPQLVHVVRDRDVACLSAMGFPLCVGFCNCWACLYLLCSGLERFAGWCPVVRFCLIPPLFIDWNSGSLRSGLWCSEQTIAPL